MSPDTQRGQGLQLSATGYVIASLTLLAAILRCISLGSKSLWLDEAASASRAAQTFERLLSEVVRREMNMALYYVMLHWWQHLAGSSEMSLRIPSVVFSTATVPLIYALGAELVDRRVGLMGALLLSVNVMSIEFAQQARSYAMVGMLVLLSSLLFVRSVKGDLLARSRHYVIAGPWAAYAHLFGVLILPAHWLSLFLFRVDRETRARLTACIVVLGLLSLPAVGLAMHGEHGQTSWIPANSAAVVLRPFVLFSGLYWWGLELREQNWMLFPIYLASIGLAIAGASRHERPAMAFLLLSIIVPVAIALLVSIFKPMFLPRYLLICLPFFVLLAAIGLMRIRPRALMVGITVLMVALSLSEDRVFYYSAGLQDWRSAINFIAANANSGDVLLVFPEWNSFPAKYYVGRLVGPQPFRMIADRLGSLDGSGGASNEEHDQLRAVFAARGIDSFKRVWIVTDQRHQNDPIMHELEAGHQVIAGPHFEGLILALVD